MQFRKMDEDIKNLTKKNHNLTFHKKAKTAGKENSCKLMVIEEIDCYNKKHSYRLMLSV
jgi:hypothetical protein